MNLWERYNPETMLGSVLGEMTGLPMMQCPEKTLFEALKRHLTRKELRCWVMARGGVDLETIGTETGLGAEEIDNAVRKASKKIRQPKLRSEFQQLLGGLEAEDA
ncbi:hypothetical protein LOH54_03350 [Sulfurimonas sp. HSL-3221]|uniref:hypothetical protein n=1 Tax=Sulfurimonadaceae TaxID=2771471 RepID=UPI001E424178|nr:hypothetical protein [Sulfurimonas sp. HSL-3221]UFS63168.1 hypothetical protein LOH54_03350 [Sulfurimonas sp. HSL-3221]